MTTGPQFSRACNYLGSRHFRHLNYRHKENNRIRVLMRQEKTMKVIANHFLDPRIVLTPNVGNDKSWVWVAFDFSDGELVETVSTMCKQVFNSVLIHATVNFTVNYSHSTFPHLILYNNRPLLFASRRRRSRRSTRRSSARPRPRCRSSWLVVMPLRVLPRPTRRPVHWSP